MCMITLCTLCAIPCITSICGVTTLGFTGLGALGLAITTLLGILAFIVSTILASGVCAVGGLLSLLYTILAAIGTCGAACALGAAAGWFGVTGLLIWLLRTSGEFPNLNQQSWNKIMTDFSDYYLKNSTAPILSLITDSLEGFDDMEDFSVFFPNKEYLGPLSSELQKKTTAPFEKRDNIIAKTSCSIILELHGEDIFDVAEEKENEIEKNISIVFKESINDILFNENDASFVSSGRNNTMTHVTASMNHALTEEGEGSSITSLFDIYFTVSKTFSCYEEEEEEEEEDDEFELRSTTTSCEQKSFVRAKVFNSDTKEILEDSFVNESMKSLIVQKHAFTFWNDTKVTDIIEMNNMKCYDSVDSEEKEFESN